MAQELEVGSGGVVSLRQQSWVRPNLRLFHFGVALNLKGAKRELTLFEGGSLSFKDQRESWSNTNPQVDCGYPHIRPRAERSCILGITPLQPHRTETILKWRPWRMGP